MSKPQTPEEIFRKHAGLNDPYMEFGDDDYERYKNTFPEEFKAIINSMKEYASQAIKYALEDAANKAELAIGQPNKFLPKQWVVDKSSILSRYESIIKDLKL